MAVVAKPGSSFQVTIVKKITRAQAATTIERLFMTDKAISGPIAARSRNFKPIPKRRGGRIWTKWPNKVHPNLAKGRVATIPASTQFAKDLASVSDFVEIKTV